MPARLVPLVAAIVSIFAAVSPDALAAAPPNDNFADAPSVTADSPEEAGASAVSGVTTEATAQAGEPAHAGQSPSHSVWYRWTAPAQEGTATFYTCGSDFDTVLGVYVGANVSMLSEVGSNDDNVNPSVPDCAGTHSVVAVQTSTNQVYSAAVDGKAGASGTARFGVVFAPYPPPPNDDIEDNEELTPNTDTASVSTVGATKSSETIPEPDHAGHPGGHSVWYSLRAPGDGQVTLDTCGSDFDTLLGVYTYDQANDQLVPVVSSDDSTACGAGSTRSQVTFSASPGEVYFIAVDGKNSASGNATISLDSDFPVPPNDDFADAQLLSGATPTAAGSNELATEEAGEPNHLEGLSPDDPNQSVWYRWTAGSTGTVTVDLCDSDFDTVAAVYTGPSVSNLALVANNDDAAAGDCGIEEGAARRGSRLTFQATAGQIYRIAVDAYPGTGPGAIQLDVVSSDPTSPTPEVPPQDNDGGAGASAPGGGGSSNHALATSSSPAKAKLAQVLKRGLAVSFTCSAACSVKFQMLMSARSARRLKLAAARPVLIGRGSSRLPAAGTKKAIVRLTAKARKRLKRARRVTITLRSTFVDNAGKKTVKTKKLAIGR